MREPAMTHHTHQPLPWRVEENSTRGGKGHAVVDANGRRVFTVKAKRLGDAYKTVEAVNDTVGTRCPTCDSLGSVKVPASAMFNGWKWAPCPTCVP